MEAQPSKLLLLGVMRDDGLRTEEFSHRCIRIIEIKYQIVALLSETLTGAAPTQAKEILPFTSCDPPENSLQPVNKASPAATK